MTLGRRITDAGSTATAVLDLVFPRVCAGCGGPVDRPSGYLCWACFSAIELRTSNLCTVCGLRIESEVGHAFVCGTCRETAPGFERARSAAHFGGALRGLLHTFKYGGGTWLCADLTDLLQGCVQAHFPVSDVDLVVPVPLHAGRQRDRGYNQAALLAGMLGRRLGRPSLVGALARVRATPTQTRLHADERRRNMRGAFAVRLPEWVRGRTILLVDDVMTTGATLSEAAATLRAAGAWRVWAATVARG